MIVTPVRVEKVRSGSISLQDLIDGAIDHLDEGTILVITSKIVSLCEGRTVPAAGTDREALIAQEAGYYLPPSFSDYGHHFTITRGTMVGSAGIDESNGDGNYVLWPADPQQTADAVRAHMQGRFGLREFGVIITDSVSQPLRLGTTGVAIAHSGFVPLYDYVGEGDLFGKPYKVERSNIAGGLAAAAVVAMGEGSEQTPLCLLSDMSFVRFLAADASAAEPSDKIAIDQDLFAPFLRAAPWKKGKGL